MNNIQLTQTEENEIQKRGFYVRNIAPLSKLAYTLPGLFFLHILSFWIMIIPILLVFIPFFNFPIIAGLSFSHTTEYIIMAVSIQLPFLYMVFNIFRYYVFSGKVVLSDTYHIYPHTGRERNPFLTTSLFYNLPGWMIEQLRGMPGFGKSLSTDDAPGKGVATIFGLTILSGITYATAYFFALLMGDISLYFGYLLIFFILFYTITYLFRICIEHTGSIYVFGNLGEKIQKLTPQIESQSKLIQSEFERDMNFGVLHTGFEKLSSTFSQIVSLVIKLENIEQKANKGNLFDSTKYINSLRSDIITPLKSLKSFFEKQRQELQNSRKELTRVRVGGSEESGNIDLQSKRSESLLLELDANITALDEMIGKIV